MAAHVSEQELMDLVEGTAAASPRAHAEACAGCRARVEEPREGLLLARDADVPEPAPLYWEAFRRQVGRRISDEAPLGRRWRLVPAFALLAAVVAVAVFAPRRFPVGGGAVDETLLPAWSALPPADEDPGLAVLQAMALSVEDLGPVAGCRGVTDCLVDLSDEESRALADALHGEKGSVL